MVFSPNLLSNTEMLKRNMQEFITTLKSAPTTDGKPVRVPGEHTLAVRDQNLLAGEIEVSDITIKKIQEQLGKDP